MAELIGLVDRNLVIKPKAGSVFVNRSFKYLSPCMKLYGDEFVTKMKLLAGLAIAIDDYGFNKERGKFENNLYYLFDVNGQSNYNTYLNASKARIDFMHIVSWLREQEYYVKDYPFDSGRNGNQHVVCLKLPFNLIDKFLQGKYSQMYSSDIIDKIIKKTIVVNGEEIINPVYGVLSHSEEYSENYLKQLNFDFGTNVTINDIKHHAEYDIPPLPKNEILRWS